MSSLTGVMPPPFDFGDLSLLPHDTKQDDIIACLVVTWAIGAAFVAARFYTRVAINGSTLGASEWTILAACVRRHRRTTHLLRCNADFTSRSFR